MARGHAGLPVTVPRVLTKGDILAQLASVDGNHESRARVLRLEVRFREWIRVHVNALPLTDAHFEKFNTSPFVVLMHAFHRGYSRISEIEADILPAKLFSSMETSAGRMVEGIMLPEYGWQCVASEMHTANSALDGRSLKDGALRLATLKSGPRCLNDEMSENFADAIINNAPEWAREANVTRLDFTYGVLYGTQKLSNKKDWHILRNIREKLPRTRVKRQPDGRWDCAFVQSGIGVTVTIRIGSDWWTYLGGANCLVEMCAAIIRACVRPGELDPRDYRYTIADLGGIVSTESVPANYNVSLLQRSQLGWLFFIVRHFCDTLSD